MERLDIDVYNNTQQTPLHLATMNAYVGMAKYLVTQGSDCLLINTEGCSPFGLSKQLGDKNLFNFFNEIKKQRLKINNRLHDVIGELAQIMIPYLEGAKRARMNRKETGKNYALAPLTVAQLKLYPVSVDEQQKLGDLYDNIVELIEEGADLLWAQDGESHHSAIVKIAYFHFEFAMMLLPFLLYDERADMGLIFSEEHVVDAHPLIFFRYSSINVHSRWLLLGEHFSHRILNKCYFSLFRFAYCSFADSKLNSVVFKSCDFHETNFHDAKFVDCSFQHVVLDKFTFQSLLSVVGNKKLSIKFDQVSTKEGEDLTDMGLAGVDLNYFDLSKAKLSTLNVTNLLQHEPNRQLLHKINWKNVDTSVACIGFSMTGEAPNIKCSSFIYAGLRFAGVDLHRDNLPPLLRLAERNWIDLQEGRAAKIKHPHGAMTPAQLQKIKFKEVNLRGFNFQEANLTQSEFMQTDLTEANLIGCELNKVLFFQVLLQGCLFDSKGIRAITDGNEGFVIDGAKVLLKPNFNNMSGLHCNNSLLYVGPGLVSKLEWINFSNSHLIQCTLKINHYNHVSFENSNLTETWFQTTDSASSMLGEQLSSAIDMVRVDFSAAQLKNTILENVHFTRTEFSNANISGTIALNNSSFDLFTFGSLLSVINFHVVKFLFDQIYLRNAEKTELEDFLYQNNGRIAQFGVVKADIEEDLTHHSHQFRATICRYGLFAVSQNTLDISRSTTPSNDPTYSSENEGSSCVVS